MGVISRDKDQINCVYASESDFGKQLEGYLKSSDKDILMIDIKKNMPSTTHWQELIEALKINPEELMDFSRIENISENSSFNLDDYVKIIENNPTAFKGAIIINGANTVHIKTVTKVLEYFDVDSAGIKKTLHSQDTTTSKTTHKDKFI